MRLNRPLLAYLLTLLDLKLIACPNANAAYPQVRLEELEVGVDEEAELEGEDQ